MESSQPVLGLLLSKPSFQVSRPEEVLVFRWVPDAQQHADCHCLEVIEAKQGPGSKTETFPLRVGIPYQNLTTSVYSGN